MFDITREMIAYGLSAVIVLVATPWLALAWVRYRRQKLRRRGIKLHGH